MDPGQRTRKIIDLPASPATSGSRPMMPWATTLKTGGATRTIMTAVTAALRAFEKRRSFR
jgi:hypothetical protein